MTRLPARALPALLLLLLLAIAGCRRDEDAANAPAPDDPVAAVEAMAAALRENDLVRWSRLSLPPELHARRRAIWEQRIAEAPPATEEEAREFDEMMERLTAPGAEAALMRDAEVKLAEFEAEIGGQWPLMQAALGVFVRAAIEANTEIDPGAKAHAGDVADSLLQWVQPSLVTDRERARRAITEVTATARALDLPNLEAARALPMEPALEKGGVALAGLKRVTAIYDLDLDESLDGMRAELVSREGDRAVVKVRYPLLGRQLAFDLEMLRRDGAWYGAGAVREAEAEIAEAEAEAQVAGAAGAVAVEAAADAAGP